MVEVPRDRQQRVFIHRLGNATLTILRVSMLVGIFQVIDLRQGGIELSRRAGKRHGCIADAISRLEFEARGRGQRRPS